MTSKPAAIVLVSLVLFTNLLFTQSPTDTLENRTDDVIEAVLENGIQDLEDSQYAETVLQLAHSPLDLNKATASDLQQIPGIDIVLAERILSFRLAHQFKSVDGLLLVEGMDYPLYLQVRDFLFVRPGAQHGASPSKGSIHVTQRTITRLQDQQGFTDGQYAGTPYKIYNRASVEWPLGSGFLLETGGLTEKDAGEKSFADFASGFVRISDVGRSFNVIVGDYIVEAGQGLVLWRPTGITKGSEVIADIAKNPRGLLAYKSSDENGFLRGGGIEVHWRNLDATVFVSKKSINATLNEEGAISSFDAVGVFRTETEIQKKSSSNEKTVGVDLDVHLSEGIRTGVRGYTTTFGKPVELSARNGFRGKQTSVGSVDFSFATDHFASFGEFALDDRKSGAELGGCLLKPLPVLDVAIVARSYAQEFVSLHGFGFGEFGGEPQNERGVYTSARFAPLPWFVVAAYFDQFATLGPSATSLLPVHGNEFFSVFQFEPQRELTLLCQLKQKKQADREIDSDPYQRSDAVVGTRTQNNYRLAFEWRASSRLRWKTWLEYVAVSYATGAGKGKGVLLYQDLRVRPKARMCVDCRVIVFDTDSYDSRIYEYESELQGTFANPALYGKGVRMYVLSRYEWKVLEFSVKYSIMVKPGMKILGSGESAIKGDVDNQVSVQLDVTV